MMTLRRLFKLGYLASSLLLVSTPMTAHGQTPPPDAPARVEASVGLKDRIAQLPLLIAGKGDYDATFAAAFRSQVPKAVFDSIGTQLTTEHGAVQTVEKVTPASPYSATLALGFEKAVATIDIAVDPNAPHQIQGLLIKNVQPRSDDFNKISADFTALPGKASFAVHALGNGAKPVAQLQSEQVMPLGSSFKLWVLAEAARQVKSGKRKWSDVVHLGPYRSLPSGMIQKWPKDAPITLQTLATLMISISDNSATDALMDALGRPQVDAMVARTSPKNADATLPLLTTIEAFKLKSPSNADLITNWKAAGADGRRKLLKDNAARLAATKIDTSMFSSKPVALDVEWFASADDMAGLLDWLRVNGDSATHQIMAVNPGVPGAEAFDYVGFKGGSEPGVIYTSWLLRTKQGNWYAVNGGWTRDDNGVDEKQFISLMNRVIQQLSAK